MHSLVWPVALTALLLGVQATIEFQPHAFLSVQLTSPRVEPRRIISVGDLHGNFTQASALLFDLGFMDENGGWVGGRDVLVQTGDVVDRGPDTREIYEALFRLQDEAPTHGGEVILLLGNHEIMNMQGDFRYTSSEDMAKLGGSNASRKVAFSSTGWPGKELRERGKAIARVGESYGIEQSVVYAHAGVLPEVAEAFRAKGPRLESRKGADGHSSLLDAGQQTISTMNEVVRVSLSGLSEHNFTEGTNRALIFHDAGPLWTRRHALSPDIGVVCEELEKSLHALRAARMIVGHTPQTDGKVHHRCDGRLVLGDTLISQGNPSAVEVGSAGEAFALYPRSGWCARESLPTVQLLPQYAHRNSTNRELRWRLATLGLTSESGGSLPLDQDVRRAYRKLARERHPDKGGSEVAFAELQLAYEGVMRSIGAV